MNTKSGIIKSVVGAKTYGVWMDMLRVLVPNGRTHRLSVVVAGMLHFAYEVACKKEKNPSKFAKLLELYEYAFEDPEEGMAAIVELAESLFKDAGVRYKRINSRGQAYSIAESAAYEFLNWENMPWES